MAALLYCAPSTRIRSCQRGRDAPRGSISRMGALFLCRSGCRPHRLPERAMGRRASGHVLTILRSLARASHLSARSTLSQVRHCSDAATPAAEHGHSPCSAMAGTANAAMSFVLVRSLVTLQPCAIESRSFRDRFATTVSACASRWGVVFIPAWARTPHEQRRWRRFSSEPCTAR